MHIYCIIIFFFFAFSSFSEEKKTNQYCIDSTEKWLKSNFRKLKIDKETIQLRANYICQGEARSKAVLSCLNNSFDTRRSNKKNKIDYLTINCTGLQTYNPQASNDCLKYAKEYIYTENSNTAFNNRDLLSAKYCNDMGHPPIAYKYFYGQGYTTNFYTFTKNFEDRLCQNISHNQRVKYFESEGRCEDMAQQWINKKIDLETIDAKAYSNFATEVCSKDGKRFAVHSCLEEVWTWLSSKPQEKIETVKKTCRGLQTIPINYDSCLDYAYHKIFHKNLELTKNERRNFAGEYCNKFSFPPILIAGEELDLGVSIKKPNVEICKEALGLKIKEQNYSIPRAKQFEGQSELFTIPNAYQRLELRSSFGLRSIFQ
jgi:hypothetical protein